MAIARRSVKREAILSLLRSVKCHPSAEWVHVKLKGEYPDLSLGTVYRNLHRLAEEGLITSVGIIGGQERFDGNISPHGHFVCRSCGAVIDVPLQGSPGLHRDVERLIGGHVESVETTAYGVCANCEDIRA